MARPDLTVRGGGIFGLSIAWACARRGARVRVIEVAEIGAGASGGIVGALAPHVPEAWNDKKAFQLDSLFLAEAWWAAVASRGGEDPGYARHGRLQPLADEAAVAQARSRAEGAARLWQDRADWRVIPASGGTWEPPSPSGWMVQDSLSARIHPRRALAALNAALRGTGAEMVVGEGDDIGPVIWATGIAGLIALGEGRARAPGGAVKGQAALLALDVGDAPQLYADGLHIVPHADGTVAIGSTSENQWGDAETCDALLDDVIARARAACPVLNDAPVVEHWAGLRPRARSRAPMLGPWPGRPGHFIANGGFKIGFGMAPGVAEAMADLVLEGRETFPPGFRVEASF